MPRRPGSGAGDRQGTAYCPANPIGRSVGPHREDRSHMTKSAAAKPLIRCPWAADEDALMQAYHDTEWGTPQHDDRALFELLTLEG
ncbi:MAG TPA: DNA-3-methyladenine glycosylase I, partial [Rhodopila sp.]